MVIPPPSSSMSRTPMQKLRALWMPVLERRQQPPSPPLSVPLTVPLPPLQSPPPPPPHHPAHFPPPQHHHVPPPQSLLPPPPPSQGWRPFALRPFYLTLIAAIMLLMLCTLEGLRRYTAQYGGLVHFQDTDDVSAVQSFFYNYVPIIIALVLVILWSFIDFDVLRLEPYFQLSRPDGAPASVLFTNYNFGQTFITPITSARRGHWVVLLVSFLTLLVRMFLPALQSTLLELREVTVVTDEDMKSWPYLVDLRTQARWISTQEKNGFDSGGSSYSSEGSLHRSRSANYAVSPVEIPMDDRRESTVWVVNQTVYWVEPACHDILQDDHLPFSINRTDPHIPSISWNTTAMPLQAVDNTTDPNCTLDLNLTTVFFPGTDFLQVRYWEPVVRKDALSSGDRPPSFAPRGCDPYDLYGILVSINATVGNAEDIISLDPQATSSATMFACNIEYHKAEAEVVMHANSSITSIKVFSGTTVNLTSDEFNIDEFRGLLAHRAPYTSDVLFFQYNQTMGDRTVTELPVISQDVGDLDPVVVLDTSTVMSKTEFEDKVKRGTGQTFLLTMGRLFNPDLPPTVISAVRLTRRVTIAVVEVAALGSEAILAFGALLTLALVYFYRTRDNIMQSDPGSIGAMCSMVSDIFSPTNILANAQSDLHQFSTRQLRMLLRNSRLYWHQGPMGRRVDIVTCDNSPPNLGDRIRTRVDPRPHFLVIPIFIIEFLLLAAVIATMSMIIAGLAREGSFQHLTQSNSSFFQIVLAFLPSMVASAVGALCNSIHRNISILEPWVHLQRGKATARSSLSMNYASQNPWSVLVKTVRDRHVLLLLVSLACVANTVLTVVAGGLFTQQLTASYLPTNTLYTNYSNSIFRQTDFAADFTEYDLIQTSITSGIPMLSWTSPNYSFIPLKVKSPDADAMYGATTLGIGAELDCRQLQIAENLIDDPDTGTLNWQYHPFNNASRQCTVDMSSLTRDKGGITLSIHFLSPRAQEEMDECQTSTVVVVGRWNYTAHSPLTDDNMIGLHCEPRVRLKSFSLLFDQKGQVQNHDPIDDSSITSGSMYENATISLGQFNKVFAAIPQSFVGEDPDDDDEEIEGDGFVSSYDWAGFLVARLYKQREGAITPLQSADLINMTQTVYQWVYSTYFSLWRNNYLQPLDDPPEAANATVIYNTWTMVPSIPSLTIALIIIALDTLVVLVVFGTRRGGFKGPRIPRSIGAVIPWIANSRMLSDFRGTYGWTSIQRRDHLGKLDKRYGFRMFLAPDGQWRYAVDEEPTDGVEKPVSESVDETLDPSKTPGAIELREVGEAGAAPRQES